MSDVPIPGHEPVRNAGATSGAPRSALARSLPWLGWAIVAVSGFAVLRRASVRWGDYQGYIACGEAVLAGTFDPVPGDNYFVWPPFFAFLCVPLALLARTGEVWPRLAFALANVAMTWAAARLWMDPTVPRERRRAALPWIVAALLSFLVTQVGYHQINLVILLPVLVGARWVGRGRPWAGGALIGLAAGLKVWPGFLVPYLWLRGERRAAASVLLAGGTTLVAPVLLFGPARALELTLRFLGAGGPTSGGAHGHRNQSLNGVLARLFATDDWGVEGIPIFRLGQLDPATSASIALVLGALLFLALTFTVARSRDPEPIVDLAVLVPAAQCLVSPVLWRHYLVVFLGGAALVASVLPRAPRGLKVLVALVLALEILQEPATAGLWLSGVVQAYDGLFALTVLGIVAAEWARRIRLAGAVGT